MIKAKEARIKAEEANDTIEKEIEALINQQSSIGNFHANWFGEIISKETKDMLEMYGYTVVRLTKHGRRIIRK